jgi:polar amino acid transport system substrate-binding protein
MLACHRLALLFVLFMGTVAMAADDNWKQELTPTGKLRVGVAYAPKPTPIFVTKDSAGEARGVAVDIGRALAQALGVPVELLVTATTAELTDACEAGKIDVGFMPADDERRKRLDFSPPYFVIESTFLAAASSNIQTIAEVNRPDVTVVGIAGSTTIRAATRSASTAKIIAAKSIDEAMALMKAGQAQAFALTQDSLPPLQKELPGSRILPGAFQVTGVAMAMPKNHPAALAKVTQFINQAKVDGTVRRALDQAGLNSLSIAP